MGLPILVFKIVVVLLAAICLSSYIIASWEAYRDNKKPKHRNSDYTISDHDWKGFKNHHLN